MGKVTSAPRQINGCYIMMYELFASFIEKLIKQCFGANGFSQEMVGSKWTNFGNGCNK